MVIVSSSSSSSRIATPDSHHFHLEVHLSARCTCTNNRPQPNPLPVKSLSHSVSKSVTKAKQAMIMLSSLPAHNFVLFALLSCKYIYLHFLQTGFLLLEKYLIVSFVSIIGSLFVLLSLFQYGKTHFHQPHPILYSAPSLLNSFANLKKVCHYSFGQEAHFVVRPHHSSSPLHRYFFP